MPPRLACPALAGKEVVEATKRHKRAKHSEGAPFVLISTVNASQNDFHDLKGVIK